MKKIYVYKLDKKPGKGDGNNSSSLDIKIWRPGITRLVPPNSTISYTYLWLMHYLKFFKSDDYSSFYISEDNKPVCSLICVPSLYKWPFMSPGDLQIKNVLTHEGFRGKGYAYTLLNHFIQSKWTDGRSYWYMTSEENIPSQKLCQKIGFEYMGRYERKRNKYFVLEGKIIK